MSWSSSPDLPLPPRGLAGPVTPEPGNRTVLSVGPQLREGQGWAEEVGGSWSWPLKSQRGPGNLEGAGDMVSDGVDLGLGGG